MNSSMNSSLASLKSHRATQWVRGALSLPLIYAMTMMWWLPEGYKYLPGFVFIAAIAFITLRGWKLRDPQLCRVQRAFMWCVVGSALYGGVNYIAYGGDVAELRAMGTTALYVIIGYGFAVKQRIWRGAVLISALGFIFISFWQHFSADIARAQGFYNPIPYATGLAVILIATCSLSLNGESKLIRYGFGALAVLLFLALMMTGTRGVMIPIILMAILLSIFYAVRAFKARTTMRWMIFPTLAAVIVVASPLIESRISATMNEIELIQSGNLTSSAGLRLQFWDAALHLIAKNPVLGVGEQHEKMLPDLHTRGLISDAVKAYQPHHYHNQFFDITVKRGLVGLVFLCLLLTIPIWQVFKHTGATCQLGPIPALVGLYATASLTDVPFNHSIAIYLYYFPLYVVFLTILVQGHQPRLMPSTRGNS